jgi:hypothetical protein
MSNNIIISPSILEPSILDIRPEPRICARPSVVEDIYPQIVSPLSRLVLDVARACESHPRRTRVRMPVPPPMERGAVWSPRRSE